MKETPTVQPPSSFDPLDPDPVTPTPSEGGAADGPAAPRSARGRRAVLIAVASVVGVAGAAAAASFMSLRGSSEALTAKLPADTDVLLTAYLDPALSQKVNLFRLTSAFPSLGGEPEVAARATDIVDAVLTPSGLTHADLDWVGSQAGVMLDVREGDDPSVALLIDTTDEGAAQTSLRAARESPLFAGARWSQEDRDGVEVWVGDDGSQQTSMSIVDGTVAITNDLSMLDEIIAVSNGDAPSLADDPNFIDTMAGLPSARLGMVYVAPHDLLPALGQSGGGGGADLSTAANLGLAAVRGIGMTITAEPGALAFDVETTLDRSQLSTEQVAALSAEDHENVLLELVPSDALAFIGMQHLDAGIAATLAELPPDERAALDRSGLEPVISSLTGDLALEVSLPVGTRLPAAAAVIGTDDEQAMTAALTLAARTLAPLGPGGVDRTASLNGDASVRATELPGPGWRTQEHRGVTVTYLRSAANGTGVAPAFAVFDGTGVIASSKNEAFRIIDVARGAPGATALDGVQAALADVPGAENFVYADLAAILEVLSDRGIADPQIREALAALHTFVAGSESDAQHQHVRLVVRAG